MSKRGSIVFACLLALASSAFAADLDAPRRGPPAIIEGIGPPLGAPLRRLPPRSPCRVIAQPEFNLSQDDVARTRPQVVCLSRGLYSDTANQP